MLGFDTSPSSAHFYPSERSILVEQEHNQPEPDRKMSIASANSFGDAGGGVGEGATTPVHHPINMATPVTKRRDSDAERRASTAVAAKDLNEQPAFARSSSFSQITDSERTHLFKVFEQIDSDGHGACVDVCAEV